MRHRNKLRRNKGFSLIELIVAIAILVILTGFLAPRFIRYIEKSRESVCRKNMDELINIYKMEYVDNTEYLVKDVIDANKDKNACPSGGTYKDITEVMRRPWILCSIHDADIWDADANTIASKEVYNAMLQFVGKDPKKIKEMLDKAFGVGNAFVSNDNLRKYLFDKIYNGSWPTYDKLINGQQMYIQPYMNVYHSSLDKTEKTDVILFANSSNSGHGSWNATMLYDPDEGKWYKSPYKDKSIGFADKSWPEIKEEMQKQKWVPVEN